MRDSVKEGAANFFLPSSSFHSEYRSDLLMATETISGRNGRTDGGRRTSETVVEVCSALSQVTQLCHQREIGGTRKYRVV